MGEWGYVDGGVILMFSERVELSSTPLSGLYIYRLNNRISYLIKRLKLAFVFVV